MSVRPKTPVSLSVLGAGGVQYGLELRPGDLLDIGQSNGIRLLDCRESANVERALVPQNNIGRVNLNSRARAELLSEENARLRDALAAARTHPVSRTLAGAQFGRARSPDASRPGHSSGGVGVPGRPGSRGGGTAGSPIGSPGAGGRRPGSRDGGRPGSRGGLNGRALASAGLASSELELAHDQMVNLGRAYLCDSEGLPDMEGWQSLKPLHRRRPGGLKPGDSMTRRIAELEAMVEDLEHKLNIRAFATALCSFALLRPRCVSVVWSIAACSTRPRCRRGQGDHPAAYEEFGARDEESGAAGQLGPAPPVRAAMAMRGETSHEHPKAAMHPIPPGHK